jgi:hypothetical protein
MSIWDRFKYAFCLNVILIGIGIVIAMIFQLDVGETLFSEKIFYPLLLVGFFAAPVFAKYIKYK